MSVSVGAAETVSLTHRERRVPWVGSLKIWGRPGFDEGRESRSACPGTVLAGQNGTETSTANDEPSLAMAA